MRCASTAQRCAAGVRSAAQHSREEGGNGAAIGPLHEHPCLGLHGLIGLQRN